MFCVLLQKFPPNRAERVERIVHKHSGGGLDHLARLAVLQRVRQGEAAIVARYAEEHVAVHAVAEFALVGAEASVVNGEPS